MTRWQRVRTWTRNAARPAAVVVLDLAGMGLVAVAGWMVYRPVGVAAVGIVAVLLAWRLSTTT